MFKSIKRLFSHFQQIETYTCGVWPACGKIGQSKVRISLWRCIQTITMLIFISFSFQTHLMIWLAVLTMVNVNEMFCVILSNYFCLFFFRCERYVRWWDKDHRTASGEKTTTSDIDIFFVCIDMFSQVLIEYSIRASFQKRKEIKHTYTYSHSVWHNHAKAVWLLGYCGIQSAISFW